jgi:hypothetical protein
MKTSSFTSTGLSDLATLVFWFHSPALRFGLCWYRSGLSDLAIVTFWFHSPALRFGLCWYRSGLSDLAIVTFWFHSPALRFGLCWYRSGLSDLASVVPLVRQLKLCWYRPGLSDLDCRMDQLAPKERFDTSIARQGYGQNHPEFLGLKDRWIIPPLAASARFTPNLI